jgi:hypothetical protein
VSRVTDPAAIVTSPTGPAVPVGHPFDAEIEAERAGWDELLELIHTLDPVEIARPGYYRDPDWSVVDLVAHLGMWLAEVGIQLERIRAGTYQWKDVDIDALNAEFLSGMHGQPWSVVLTQARHRVTGCSKSGMRCPSEGTMQRGGWQRRVLTSTASILAASAPGWRRCTEIAVLTSRKRADGRHRVDGRSRDVHPDFGRTPSAADTVAPKPSAPCDT